MTRSQHLVLFYALFAAVFVAALAMVGGPPGVSGSEPNDRLGLLPPVPATPQPLDAWFDHPTSDPSLDRHVPALRGVVYDEAIHDMPVRASPEKKSQ